MGIKPRYRITIDIPENYVRMVETVMESQHLTQSQVIRLMIQDYYDRHRKGADHDETPTPGSGDAPRRGGF